MSQRARFTIAAINAELQENGYGALTVLHRLLHKINAKTTLPVHPLPFRSARRGRFTNRCAFRSVLEAGARVSHPTK
jgi:hypothetical protein